MITIILHFSQHLPDNFNGCGLKLPLIVFLQITQSNVIILR